MAVVEGVDKYKNTVDDPSVVDFDVEGDLLVEDSVGLPAPTNDPADVVTFATERSSAVAISALGLENLAGSVKNLKFEVFEGAAAKASKTYTIKNTGVVDAKLLLKGNMQYTFRITAADTSRSVVGYSLSLHIRQLLHKTHQTIAFCNTNRTY